MPEQQKVVIKLSGSLAAKFGRVHVRYLESGKTWEAFSALKRTVAGFEQFVMAQAKLGMRYAIFRNGSNVAEDEFDFAGTREIRVVPIMEGSKRGGVLQTIVGAVLVVVGVIVTGLSWGLAAPVGGALISAGVGLMAGGIVQMLSPQNLNNSSNEDQGTSYAFGGAVNTTAQGNPVGIGYGERLVGGAIISAGIYAEDQR
ncbi:tail assembly protein [Shewanella sp. KCT]|uniref:tail assembly protein n=1 Tax=Shewanella sp. KCT TaxID=2569535 RepID=UPI0011820B69|nr:tail assembly protein [Shewanella sp. KCT]TVP11815.1 phage tail protein [Shewanella sp. KCT]